MSGPSTPPDQQRVKAFTGLMARHVDGASAMLMVELGRRVGLFETLAAMGPASTMHCMTVSLAHGGAGLGTAWGLELAQAMLKDAGFTEIRVHERVDPANTLFVAR